MNGIANRPGLKPKNQAELADVFGTSTNTLGKWKRLGMPVDDTARAIDWKVRYELGRTGEETLNLEDERALLAREQRLKVEQDRKARTGQLLEADAVLKMWSGIIAEMRSKILNTDLPDQTKADLIEDLRDIPLKEYDS